MMFYKKSDFINLLISSFAVLGLRLLLVNVFILSPGIRSDDLTQLYFGGLSIDFSFDLMKLSLYLAMISIEVIVINENLISGILENFEIIKCRTCNTNKIFYVFIRTFFFNTFFLVISNYLFVLILERNTPVFMDFWILLSECILIINLDIIYLAIRCNSKSKLAYLILLIAFIFPVIFTGFMFEQGNDGWMSGKYLILSDYIFNFTHSITLNDTLYHDQLITSTYPLIFSVWSETLCKISLSILAILLSKNFFRKYSKL